MGVGGIRSHGKNGFLEGVSLWYESRLGGGESGLHRQLPGEDLGII